MKRKIGKKALHSSTLRDIKGSFGRFFAILAITFLGVGFFSGVRITTPAMVHTVDNLVQEKKLYDYRLVSTYGWEEEDVDTVRNMENVAYAEGSFQYDVICINSEGKDSVYKAYSLTENINKLMLKEGRLPEAPDEVLLDNHNRNGYKLGDTIELSETNDEDTLGHFANNKYKIVGFADSILYINFERGNTPLGNGTVSGFMYMTREGFDEDIYTEIYVKLDTDAEIYSDEYNDLMDDFRDEWEKITDDTADNRFDRIYQDAEEEIQDAKETLEEESADAKSELDDAKSELDDAKSELESAAREIEDGEAELNDAASQLSSAKSTLNSSKETLDSSKETLDSSKSQLASAKETLDSSKSQLDEAKVTLDDSKATLDENEALLEESAATLDESKKTLDESKTKLDDSKAVLDESKEVLDESKTKLDDSKTVLDESKAKLDENKTLLDESKIALDDTKAMLDESKASLDENKQILEETKSQLDSSSATLDATKKQLDSAAEEISTNEEAITEAEKNIDMAVAAGLMDEETANASRKELDSKKLLLQAAKDEYNAGLAQYEEGLSQYEAGYAQYEEGMSKYEAGLAQYEEGLSQYEAGLAEWNAGNEQYEAGLDQWTTGNEQYEAGLAEWTAGNDKYEAGLDEWTAGKEAYDTGLAQYEAGKEQYDTGLAAWTAGKEEYDAGVETYDSSYAQYESGLATYEENYAKYEEGVAQYESGLAQYNSGLATYNSSLGEYYKGVEELEEGKAEYEDGLAQYEDGLAEYEDGLEEYNEKIADAEQEIADAEQELSELDAPETFVLERNTNIAYVCFENDSEIVEQVARVFPIFFILVAALVCMTTMTRMVEEQRSQIGTLKALGYSNGDIVAKFTVYAGSAALIGCITGYAICIFLFPFVIWNTYQLMYIRLPLDYIFDWKLAIMALIVSLICSVGTTLISCRYELLDTAANLMRPKAPKAGRRVFLEYIPFIWNRLKFLHKVSIRNILRYKRRFFMMIIGISGCTALVLTGFGMKDSVAGFAEAQYDEIQIADAELTFNNGTENSVPQEIINKLEEESEGYTFIKSAAWDMVAGKNVKGVNLIAPVGVLDQCGDKCTGDMNAFFKIADTEGNPLKTPAKGEALICISLAERYNIRKGDKIILRDDEMNEVDVTVTGIFDNHVYNYVFVSPDDIYTEINGAYINFPEGTDIYEAQSRLSDCEDVVNVSLFNDFKVRMTNMMSSLNYIVLIVILSAAGLAFVVLYNLTNINITERIREIATIKVLGFYANETAQYVFRENIVLTFLGMVLGLGLGVLLHRFVMAQIIVDMVHFKVNIEPLSYLFSVCLTYLFTFLVNLVMRRKLSTIDMAESLKSVE